MRLPPIAQTNPLITNRSAVLVALDLEHTLTASQWKRSEDLLFAEGILAGGHLKVHWVQGVRLVVRLGIGYRFCVILERVKLPVGTQRMIDFGAASGCGTESDMSGFFAHALQCPRIAWNIVGS
jgi:hypothetical protein